MDRLLFSWLGRTDLRAIEEADTVGTGPVAQALDTSRFSHLALICDYSATEAQAYLDWLRQRNQTPVTVHSVELDSPTNFDAIYREARRIVAETIKARSSPPELTFHLSPGTPAMAAVWIILAKTRFPAELIESSIRYGVRSVSIPFQMAADFIPDLLRRSDDELTRLTAGLPPAAPAFDAIIHRSAVMQRVVARARRVALRSIPVLIEGDSGTGKELLARAIHQASPRCERPMVTVNCGAIAADLIESELFGHEKGAFTGAISARQGVFEAADTGTLFLDEIGELSKPAQVRFLRALQEGEITRVGATRSIRVDVRIIAATNRSLSQEVSSSRFREDLFYRLAVAVIVLPPLRERDGDVALLLDRLLDQINRESETEPGYEPKKLSVTARKLLLEHAWPGNIRELLNTLRRAAVWTPGPTIDLDDARDALLPGPQSADGSLSILGRELGEDFDLERLLDDVKRHYLERALAVAQGNKTRAAQLLGFGNPTTLTNWLKKYDLKP